ncbi:MAG: diacylglycerol/lipid kinase family protein [Lachnospiraceae bacterium]
MKKMLFIINPKSGKGQIKNHLLEILDIFTKADYGVQVYVTQQPLDARQMVIESGENYDLIVCSGGDGTLNETISGMMELKSRPRLGYIPAGSTNDFASSLGIPRQMFQAAGDAVSGMPYPIDIGIFCRERYFVYVAGFGLFTEVSYLTPQDKKNVLGHQAYMLEGVKSLSSIKTYQMTIDCEEMQLDGEFIFGMITNTISVGGFKGLVNQDVELNDGYFEVLLIRKPKKPTEFSNIVSTLFLKEEPNEFVYKFKTRKLHIKADEAVDWVLDGEFGGTHEEIIVENLTKQLEIHRTLAKKS